jgi:hypothetical protein
MGELGGNRDMIPKVSGMSFDAMLRTRDINWSCRGWHIEFWEQEISRIVALWFTVRGFGRVLSVKWIRPTTPGEKELVLTLHGRVMLRSLP